MSSGSRQGAQNAWRRQRGSTRQLLLLAAGFLAGYVLSKAIEGPKPLHEGDGCDTADGSRPLAVNATLSQALLAKRKVYVGVQTGFTTDPRPKYNYPARRAALRASWFPGSRQELDRLEREQGIVVRFVIGHSADPQQEAALLEEQQLHRDFLRLNLTEGYAGLPTKTLQFLRAVTEQYDVQYIVKADDDVYLRLDRLPHAIPQWSAIGADYIGCMKTGQVIKSPRYRWYEPQHALLGPQYFVHAWGSIYVLSGRVAADLAVMRDGALRQLANEDVTIGTWLLAFNAKHYDDRRLCETNCTASSLAVYDMPVCAGLCDAAVQLPQLHASHACHLPAVSPTGALPLAKPLFLFDGQPDPAWDEAAVRQLQQKRARVARGERPTQPEYDTTQPL